jgi:hypothetical protein
MADEQRQLSHIYLPGNGAREDFTSPRSGGGSGHLPQRDRAQHAQQLEQLLAAAVAAAEEQIAARDPEIAGGTPGFYLEFDIPQAQQAVLDKLENRRGQEQIELVAARQSPENPALVKATVFVPESKREYYLGKVRAYAAEDNVRYIKDEDGNELFDENGSRIEKSRRPKNEALVASIDFARLAEAASLYTDDPRLFPAAGRVIWWEIWLRPEGRAVFEHAAARLRVPVREHVVSFAEREVILARAAPDAIAMIVSNTDAIAELRLARDTPALFMEMDGAEQTAWSDELAARLVAPENDAPAVCILDSGTTIRHPLIAPALTPEDQQAWRADWHGEDTGVQWRGHGTRMSGIALYGDLTDTLVGNEPVQMFHRLESVKILPDRGANDPDLYGFITASAIGRAEVQAPARRRAYCLAVTSESDYWRGRPSSWSAKIDDLAYGDGDDRRLIIISAGNIGTYYPAQEYLNQNDTVGIESPAQAWNAITVGAMTEKCTITDASYAGWQAMAPPGDLAPCSRTSVPWHYDWPTKPDIVFEGGNHGIDPTNGNGDHLDDLALLTTFNRPEERPFTVTGDTSAATALASRMAARIMADQPRLWPETVRALMVHSAEWTPAMRAHLPENPNQSHQRLLLRRYGYGVPHLTRALRSLFSDVTLVIESELQPYEAEGSQVRSRDMILHDLPWPVEALAALGETTVEMRVTLSYFVEPNPGERGWTKRHRYAGHGLRFAVKRPEESLQNFRRRVNAAARDEDEQVVGGGNDDGWVLGPRLRDRGSLHADIWRGTATDLSNRHGIGVYPVGGWWREKPRLERTNRRARYALVVSLRAGVDVDLYTEIVNAIGIEVDIDSGLAED